MMGGHIGTVVNENGDKFLSWILKSIEKDSESETATATIYVVDAVDPNNITTVTKEIDRSERDGNHNGNKRANIDEKLERLSQPTGEADVDAARATFVEKLQELKASLESGDSERASELRDELKDLRSGLGNIKSYRK